MKNCIIPLLLLLASLEVVAQRSLSINCPPDQTNWVCGNTFAMVTYPAPQASGGCAGTQTVTCTPPSGAVFTLGVTKVNCLATNDCGESVRCSFDITLARDTTPPAVNCPTNLLIWISPTNGAPAKATNVQFNLLATDAQSGLASVVCTPPSGSTFPVGETTVVCTATDLCTNRTDCLFTVTVIADTNAPTLQCPADVSLWSCDTNTMAVNYPAPVVSDDFDGSPIVICLPPSGSVFPAGATTVTCTATDDAGNQSRCSFNINVGPDPFAPTIFCPPDVQKFTCSTNGRIVDYNAPVADDNIGLPAVVCTPPSHSFFPVGTTVVTCTAEDACGNQAQCAFNVTVTLDTELPVIDCPNNRVISVCDDKGAIVTWPHPEVTDNHIATYAVFCTPPSGSVFPIGVTTVTCRGSDSCENRAECTFTVTVQLDTSLPGVGIDTDGNGLNDIWEIHYQAGDLAPGDDTDGDGATNAEEMAAGTDPRNAASRAGLQIGLGDGSVRFVQPTIGGDAARAKRDTPPFYLKLQGVDGDVTASKAFQLWFTPELGQPWRALASPVRGTGTNFILEIPPDDPVLSNSLPRGFFRVKVYEVDEDQDGLTAWEELTLGTSDQTPNSAGGAGLDVLIGNTGGDRQAALDWIAGNLGKARLREVALAHLGGSPLGPTQTKLVTAAGTGGWLKLSSWTLDPGSHEPKHLEDTEPFEGWNVKLEVLEPPGSPTLTLNPFICGRIQNDENLWLTSRRVDADGQHSELSTLGYGANASFRVHDYAMAHQPVTGTAPGVESFIVVTPMLGYNTGNQLELRVVSWSVSPVTGAINGLYDTGSLGHTDLPENGAHLQIVREGGGRYVVSYLNRFARLTSWFFDVNANGLVSPRGGATSGLDIRGHEMDPIVSTDFVLGGLNASGFVTLLVDTNCSARFAVWEDRVTACDNACFAKPFLITDSSLDLKPNAAGVMITPPVVTDAWDDTAFKEDQYGRALAAGDFNGDGWDDLAIGIPGHKLAKENAPGATNAGRVFIKHGHPEGLTNTYPDRAWSQDSDGVIGVADPEDRFGQALATGDFNGDGFADLAIGAPGEEVDGVPEAGAVNVLYGSASGLRANGNQIWYQGASGLPGTPDENDRFGYTLTTGDFDNDGFADLVIGVPYENVIGFPEAGAVQVIYGSANGLSAAAGPGAQLMHQGSALILGSVDANDHFGLALTAGDLNGDGRDDLVVGVPDEDASGVFNSGAVQIIYGSANGLSTDNQLISQGSIQPAGGAFAASPDLGDGFGRSVAVGDFNEDGFADLAVGVPFESIEASNVVYAGVVHIFRGSATGVTATEHQMVVQYIPENGDLLGLALATGDFNGDGAADLAIACPYENVHTPTNTISEAGMVVVLKGGPNSLTFATYVYQGYNDDFEEEFETADHFGSVLTTGDFNNDGLTDLAVGVPDEDLVRGGDENRSDAGVVHAIYGSESGLSGSHDQVWAQGEPFRVRALLTDKQREASGIGEGKLFEKMPAGERTNVHVASVTKCMTLLLAAELLQTPGADVHLDDEVEVSALAAGTGGSIMEPPYGPVLEEGDIMPLELLLHGMMQRSCNKSSVAIGEHLARKQYKFLHGAVPPGFDATAYFITNMMQGKADALGMVNTLCGHAAGGMITTPQDLVTLWQHAWQFADFRQISGATSYTGSGEDDQGNPKNYFLVKHSSGEGYPGLDGWKGGNGGLWHFTFPFGVPLCAESSLGQATRLGRSLTFALQQTHDRWDDAPAMLDYGYRQLFTPDLRGGGALYTPALSGFAVRSVHDTLAVSAVIHGTNTLRLDAWQVVAGIGQANPLNHSTLEVSGLPHGTHAPHVKVFDLTRLPSVGESEADYVTGRLDGGMLRLNVWRVAAQPGF